MAIFLKFRNNALGKNSKEIGELLISKGANINVIDFFLSKYNNIILNKKTLKKIKEINSQEYDTTSLCCRK